MQERRNRSGFLLLIFLYPFLLKSQGIANAEKFDQVWIGYFNQTRISNHWGTWLDLHVRTKDHFVDSFSQAILRVGATYYAGERFRIMAGYAYVNQFPGDNHKNVSQPEHRGWQMLQWSSPGKSFRINQAIRLEEKFKHKILNNDALAPGYGFYWKFRYGISFNIPIKKVRVFKSALSFVVSDEIHLNFGKEITYHHFDQNRFFAGFSLNVNAKDNLQIGYMNQVQQSISNDYFKNVNVLRIFYFQQIDHRKSKSLLNK
ncbi:MAG: hypothetical protein RLZZ28_2746 [Bacteroidota bacterium]|jgi:hypothetical protein